MQRSRILVLLLSLIFAFALLAGTLALAAPAASVQPAVPAAPAESASYLFMGVDDSLVPAYAGNLASNVFTPVFSGTEVWGAAYDPDQHRVLFNDGWNLWQWPVGGDPSFLGEITIDGSRQTMAGLAYFDGTLFASRFAASGQPVFIYAIDLNTLAATTAITVDTSGSHQDLGGIDIDPATGKLYAANDAAAQRGLVEIRQDGTVTFVAPYPDGEDEVDGLAVGGGNAYLIPDSPRPIHVFNFATMTYTAPIPNPRTDITATIFAGGAYFEQSGYSLYLPALTR